MRTNYQPQLVRDFVINSRFDIITLHCHFIPSYIPGTVLGLGG